MILKKKDNDKRNFSQTPSLLPSSLPEGGGSPRSLGPLAQGSPRVTAPDSSFSSKGSTSLKEHQLLSPLPAWDENVGLDLELLE